MKTEVQQPKKRSVLRSKMGMLYYGALRKRLWRKMGDVFAKKRFL